MELLVLDINRLLTFIDNYDTGLGTIQCDEWQTLDIY